MRDLKLSMNRPLTPSLSPSDGERVAGGRVRGGSWSQCMRKNERGLSMNRLLVAASRQSAAGWLLPRIAALCRDAATPGFIAPMRLLNRKSRLPMNRTPSPRPSPPVGEKVPGGRLRGIPTGSWPQLTSKFWRCSLSMSRPTPGPSQEGNSASVPDIGSPPPEGLGVGSWLRFASKFWRFSLSMNHPLTPSLSPSDGERVAGGRVRGGSWSQCMRKNERGLSMNRKVGRAVLSPPGLRAVRTPRATISGGSSSVSSSKRNRRLLTSHWQH